MLQEVLKPNKPVEYEDIQPMDRQDAADKLNADLLALVSGLHSDRAWSHLKNVKPTEGLEAYRWVFK